MHFINTPRGPKSPDEAFALFKQATMPAGNLLGIFNQLESFPSLFKQACQHVLSNLDLYSAKLQRIAKEKSTGRPIGVKVINDEMDLNQFLWRCGLRAHVAITVKKNHARSIRPLLSLSNLEIDELHKAGLTAVATSGEWQSVPRTFTAILSLTSDDMIPDTQSMLFGTIESIELLSTLTERAKAYRTPAPLSEEVKAVLAANPNLFYDRTLFIEVCRERAFGAQEERIDELSIDVSMEEALMLFLSNGSREEFLEYYITRFEAALT